MSHQEETAGKHRASEENYVSQLGAPPDKLEDIARERDIRAPLLPSAPTNHNSSLDEYYMDIFQQKIGYKFLNLKTL